MKVVRHGACYKHTHLTVLCRIGLMDKIVHYSKMSKTLEKPRKSFSKRWEPAQKRAGSVSPTSGGNGAWRSVCFLDRPWRQHFTDPFSVYCVLPQTHTTVRISDGVFLISPALFSFRMSRLLTSKFVMRWYFTTLCFRLGSAVCPKNGRPNYFPVDNIHSYLI